MSGYFAFDSLVLTQRMDPGSGSVTARELAASVVEMTPQDGQTGFTVTETGWLDVIEFLGAGLTFTPADGRAVSLTADFAMFFSFQALSHPGGVTYLFSFQHVLTDDAGSTAGLDLIYIPVSGAPLPAFADGDALFDFFHTYGLGSPTAAYPAATEVGFDSFDIGYASATGDTITGTDDADTLYGLAGDDLILGVWGDDILDGGAGHDTLQGGEGADTLLGGAGNDVLRGGLGNYDDVLQGGDGIDTVDYTDLTMGYWRGGLIVNLAAGTATDNWFYVANDTLVDIENANGTGGSDTLIGSAGANVLDGREGADSLSGGDGDDTLLGGINDPAHPGDNDTLDGGAGNDSLSGGVGDDLLLGGADDDRIAGGTGNDGLDGGDGLDWLSGEHGNDFLSGWAGNDTLLGGAGTDTLQGGTGNDWLDGGVGADSLEGGEGNDTYVVDATDTLRETNLHGLDMGGRDTVRAGVDFSLAAIAFVEDLVLTGAAAIDGTGNSLANTITGNAGANGLFGGAGNDLLTGGGGADTLSGGTGADRMLGGAGNDVYRVDLATDRVFETTTQTGSTDAGGIDRVEAAVSFSLAASVGLSFVENLTLTGTAVSGTGNALGNTIIGTAAANRLDGGLGADRLTGGAGADWFIFSTAPAGANIDRITDFNVEEDTIRLDDAVFAGLATGRLTAAAFATNLSGQAQDALDRIIYESDTGRLWFDADGTGAGARVQVAVLSAGLDLTNADFVIF